MMKPFMDPHCYQSFFPGCQLVQVFDTLARRNVTRCLPWRFVQVLIAAVCGSITAVLFTAAITFIAVTFTYKSEKKMIVDQVRANVVMAGIAAAIDMVTELELALMPPVRAVAAEFVWSCLRVWDGVLGWRALGDSHLAFGKPFGIGCLSSILFACSSNTASQCSYSSLICGFP